MKKEYLEIYSNICKKAVLYPKGLYEPKNDLERKAINNFIELKFLDFEIKKYKNKLYFYIKKELMVILETDIIFINDKIFNSLKKELSFNLDETKFILKNLFKTYKYNDEINYLNNIYSDSCFIKLKYLK